MPRTVALISGGMDSATLLWLLKPDVKALAFNYGQRHSRELTAARQLCDMAGVFLECVNLSGLNYLIAKGSQSGPEQPPEGHYTEMSMKTTIVPNRNSIMLSIAVGHAVTIGAENVTFACHAGDHVIYPDCRPEFVEAFDHAMQLANAWTPVSVQAPFANKTKAEIARIGHELGVPFELTWSCYKGGDKHCGKCGTCVERREAFQLAGIEDPTEYDN